MGCASSKRIEAATVDIYRPPPSSFAMFDINSIQEPWLTVDNSTAQEQQEKPSHVPALILEKLNTFESDAPIHSWDELSKALEDLKPSLNNKSAAAVPAPAPKTAALHPSSQLKPAEKKEAASKKSFSFHTLEEFEAKLSPKPEKEAKKTESFRTELKPESRVKVTESRGKAGSPATELGGGVIKPVKENIFIVRDKQEREKEGKMASYEKMMSIKRDPLGEFPEKCPPGGAQSIVLYTTSLRGVRKTFEDCNRVRDLLEGQRVVWDERDVSLHGEFLNELRGLVGEGASVPRIFVKGRYVGGVKEWDELNESGRLGRILSWARVERGVGSWQACEGCGGARFVPCLDCGGSCKIVVDGVKERCGKCNENGLVRCPACL